MNQRIKDPIYNMAHLAKTMIRNTRWQSSGFAEQKLIVLKLPPK